MNFTGDGQSLSPSEYAGALASIFAEGGIEPDYYSLGGAVTELEGKMAVVLGKERAVFLPTGTLANHLAVPIQARGRRRVIVQEESHIYNDSGDCSTVLSDLNLVTLARGEGTFTVEDVEQVLARTAAGRVRTEVGVIVIESPIRRRLGELFDYEEMGRVCRFAREHGIATHLGAAVASMAQDDVFPLGLLGNCNSSLGMLAGLQHAGPSSRPLKVGLIWIDAHADFNTPETTMSGWLGGMPVSVAAGKSLFRLRLQVGLDPPISTRNIVMMGLRDVDPLEQVLVDESDIGTISTEEMLQESPRMRRALQRLSDRVDVIYLHIDLDILDATEIPGSFFEVPGGPTADQLAEPVRLLMRNPKVGALGIASFPTAEEGRARSMESTMTLIRAAMMGLTERQPSGGGEG